MAINPSRCEARLAKMQEILKKNPEDPKLQQNVKNCEAALAKKTSEYPQKLKRHIAKCKKYGWADSRLGKKK